jgi:hypothetical protein
MRATREGTIVAALVVCCIVAVGAGFALGRATTASSAAAAGKSRVYTGRAGDVLRVPAAAARCTVSREAGATNLICVHTPRARYSVVFYRDNLFVYRNGNPDNPVFSARGRP